MNKQINCLLVSHELSLTGAPMLLLELAKTFYTQNIKIDLWILNNLSNTSKKMYDEFNKICNTIKFLHSKISYKDIQFAKENYKFIICNTYLTANIAYHLNAILWCHEYNVKNIDMLNKVPVIALTDKHREILKLQGVNTTLDITIHCRITPQPIIPVDNKVNNNKVNIIVVGYFHPIKNQLGALDIVRPFKNVHLTMVGNFKNAITLNDDYYRLVKENIGDIDCELIDVQPHEKVIELISGCDIMLCPSTFESYSKVAIEALERGKTVLLTNKTCNDFEDYLIKPYNSRILPVNQMQEYLKYLIETKLYKRPERLREYNYEERCNKLLSDLLE